MKIDLHPKDMLSTCSLLTLLKRRNTEAALKSAIIKKLYKAAPGNNVFGSIYMRDVIEREYKEDLDEVN